MSGMAAEMNGMGRVSERVRGNAQKHLGAEGDGDVGGGEVVRTGRVESTASEERAIYLPGVNSGKLPSSSMIRRRRAFERIGSLGKHCSGQ